MVVELKKWGNSLGLQIPGDIAQDLGLSEGSEVVLEVEGDTLVLKTQSDLKVALSAKPFRLRPLEELVALKPGNKGVVEVIREMRDEGW